MSRDRRCGLRRYASIYHALRKPMSRRQVSEQFGTTIVHAGEILAEMHTLGMVHVAGWKRESFTGSASRLYRAGRGVDVLPPPTRLGKPGKTAMPHKVKPRAHIIALRSLIDALEVGITTADLVRETGLSLSAIQKFVKHCREIGLIHISAWKRLPFSRAPLYELGSEPDAPKPARMGNATVCRRWRRKQAASLLARPLVNSVFAWGQA